LNNPLKQLAFAGRQLQQRSLHLFHSDHPSLQHGHAHRPLHQSQAFEVFAAKVDI
jgi:hypothetical protein